MSKWLVTVALRDPEDMNQKQVLDSVRWALEDSYETEGMALISLTIEPSETLGKQRKLAPAYVEPDCDPTTGICHYGKVE